jgi:hypothetical protein
MAEVPLPTGIAGDDDIPELQEFLVNLFNPGDNTLVPTPGIDSFTTGEGVCRGAVDFQEEHYQVSGTSFVKVATDGTVTVLGTIGGTEECVLSTSFIAIEIIVKGGAGFSYSPSGGLVSIGGSFVPCVDVDQINQRFVFVPADGGPLFYTDVNAPTTIPPLNFFDAELLPDLNKGCINLKNDFYVGGQNSFEVFRDTGPTDSPFQRVGGAAIETGYVAARAIYRDTFVFLGRDRGGAFSFHAMSSGDAPKISNTAIDELLNEEYTLAELETCLPQRITWKSVDAVAFRLPRHTLFYYGTGWSYIQSNIDGFQELQPWSVSHVTFSYGKYITGSAVTNAIGKLSTANTEFGNQVERQIQTFVKAPANTYLNPMNLFLRVTTGSSGLLEAPTVGLQVSRDNLTYGPRVWRGLGKSGKSQQQVVWYGGLGVFESYLGIQIRTTANVKFAVDGMQVDGV